MGGAWYIIRNSVKCEEQNNGKTIYATIASVGEAEKGNTKIGSQKTYRFYFDEKNGHAGTASDQAIIYFKYDGPRSVTMVKNGAGAMAYYIATGKKWSKFGLGKDFYSPADL